MFSCRRVRGLMAASVYDDLSEGERETLSDHLKACGACRRQQAAFQELAARIRFQETPVLEYDLVPGLRAQLGAPVRPDAAGLSWRHAFAGAMALALVGIFSYGIFSASVSPPAGISQTDGLVAVAAASPVDSYLSRAQELVDQHDYTGAFRVLREAVEAHGDAPRVGDAQLALANLAFEKLHWYHEADAAYQAVQRNHREVLERAEDIATILDRWEMLAEARTVDYASLHELDSALRDETDIGSLEKVMARYPATFVGAAAAAQLARRVGERENIGDMLQAMERARDLSSDPVAVAQLNLEIAHECVKRRELDKARELYNAAASAGTEPVARVAQVSLNNLRSGDGR